MSDVQQRIDDLVKSNRVMLFMKGTAQFPQCGFSGRAIQVLKAAGARLGLSVSGSALPLGNIGADAASAAPYLGLGFSGAPWHNGLSISADIGLVAERLGTTPGAGRAVFGNQAMDNAARELRLSPLLQLGVRYAF